MTDARSAIAGINRAAITSMGTSRQLPSSAGAGISRRDSAAALQRRLIGFVSSALQYSTSIQSQPAAFQYPQYGVRRAGNGARRIDILNPHPPLATPATGFRKLPSAAVSGQMQRPGWRARSGHAPPAVSPCGVGGQPCFSRISSSILQSMHSVAVGQACIRSKPISTPQAS